jgi:hypothetical protein
MEEPWITGELTTIFVLYRASQAAHGNAWLQRPEAMERQCPFLAQAVRNNAAGTIARATGRERHHQREPAPRKTLRGGCGRCASLQKAQDAPEAPAGGADLNHQARKSDLYESPEWDHVPHFERLVAKRGRRLRGRKGG